MLTLAPMLAVTNGMLLFIKGGLLSGEFYPYAAAVFLTMVPMALFPAAGIALFGLVSAACFFATGLRYRLRRLRAGRADAGPTSTPGWWRPRRRGPILRTTRPQSPP